MPAPVLRNAAIGPRCGKEHLIFPDIRTQRPSVTENDRLTFVPIIAVNLSAVFGRDGIHHILLFVAIDS